MIIFILFIIKLRAFQSYYLTLHMFMNVFNQLFSIFLFILNEKDFS
jgi:hypothetical protein